MKRKLIVIAFALLIIAAGFTVGGKRPTGGFPTATPRIERHEPGPVLTATMPAPPPPPPTPTGEWPPVPGYPYP